LLFVKGTCQTEALFLFSALFGLLACSYGQWVVSEWVMVIIMLKQPIPNPYKTDQQYRFIKLCLFLLSIVVFKKYNAQQWKI